MSQEVSNASLLAKRGIEANEATADQRMKHLERRINLVGVSGLIVFAIAIVGYTLPTNETVRAERFELVSTDGTLLATLETNEQGATGLFVRDDSGRVRISISNSHEEAALFIKDAAGDTRLGAAQFSHGGVGLALHGDQMKGAAVMYLSNRKGSFRLFDENGTVVNQIVPND
jgi:hypothetical protein